MFQNSQPLNYLNYKVQVILNSSEESGQFPHQSKLKKITLDLQIPQNEKKKEKKMGEKNVATISHLCRLTGISKASCHMIWQLHYLLRISEI